MQEIASWLEEQRSAYLYRIIAEKAQTPAEKKLFSKLAEEAEKQAALWASRAGAPVPAAYRPDLRTRVIAHMVRRFGPRAMKEALCAMKVRGMSIYNQPSVSLPSAPAPALEHGHPMPKTVEEVGKRHWGLSTGNNLRAAVFGISDGLVSNVSLILGVAGAHVDTHLIVLTGLAGLLAGAFSMGAGEYVSVRSQRELFEYQIGLEKQELEAYPDEEAAELALIYNARGVPEDEAKKVANTIIQDPEKALDTLAREELGLNPDELGSPWGAAVSSFLSFGVGALVPLLPFLLAARHAPLLIAIALSMLSLFAVGAALSLFSGKSAFFGGGRMLLVGFIAGGATYLIGHFLGVNLS